MRLLLCLGLILIGCMAPFPAIAAEVPVPVSKTERLDAVQNLLKDHKQQEQELKSKIREIEKELKNTKDKLVGIAGSVQKSERTLQQLEEKIGTLEVEKMQIEQNLKNDRQAISRLILALERIRRVPPEALIAKPGAPLETAQSAMLLGDIIPALHKQAETLKINLQSLEEIEGNLKKDREKAKNESESLRAEHDKLAGLVDRRERLYTETSNDLSAQQKHVERMSKEAKTLQDLVNKLEAEKQRRAREIAEETKQQEEKTASAVTEIPKPGTAQLPISGTIKIRYNDLDSFGAKSKGIEIEGHLR